MKINKLKFFSVLWCIMISLCSGVQCAQTIDEKGLFYNKDQGGWTYLNTLKVKGHPAEITFNQFEGHNDLLLGHQGILGPVKQITIPRDGVYSLSAHYLLIVGQQCYTGIKIVGRDDRPPYRDAPYGSSHDRATTPQATTEGIINRVTRLKRDDKVMFVMDGDVNTQCFMDRLWLEIEKLHD